MSLNNDEKWIFFGGYENFFFIKFIKDAHLCIHEQECISVLLCRFLWEKTGFGFFHVVGDD